MESYKVDLYIYDLSRGIASKLSPMFLGKSIDGVWHTAIVIYNREFFFGARGLESCDPGTTTLGAPIEVLKLGETQVSYSVFKDYLDGLSQTTFAGNTYHIINHNCNHFTEELAQFLCGTSIPKYILDLPQEVLNSNFGPILRTIGEQLEKSARPISEEGNGLRREVSPDLTQEIEEARYQSFILQTRRERINEKLKKDRKKKDKKHKKKHGRVLSAETQEEHSIMAEAETVNGSNDSPLPSEQAFAMEEEERREAEEKKKCRDPPIVYKDLVDVKEEFDALIGLIDGKLSPEEQRSTEELQQYMIGDEGSWALSDGFLDFVNRLLNDKDFPHEARIRTLNLLAMAALKDDIILVLHQDRKDHVLMNYAYDIDRLNIDEQEAVALFMANMFENLSSSEWLLYISEWTYNNQQISNIRVTTKVAVHCLLSDAPLLQERGSAIIHNLAAKEVKTVVFDDIAVELTMALLQYFNSKPAEEQLFRCMKALSRFTEISRQEVPQLIQMIGPDPKTFKGTSERIDALIDQVCSRIR